MTCKANCWKCAKKISGPHPYWQPVKRRKKKGGEYLHTEEYSDSPLPVHSKCWLSLRKKDLGIPIPDDFDMRKQREMLEWPGQKKGQY